MTNAPAPGWYDDPEMVGRLRYWDGSRWTEHLAARQPVPTPSMTTPLPSYGRSPIPPVPSYGVPQQQPTLFNNPYQKAPRVKRSVENTLDTSERVRAAALDAALVVPFIIAAFILGPVLGWVSGDGNAQGHAYRAAGIALAIVLGVGVIAWNFLRRETTLGTQIIAQRKQKGP